jgi:hypothetical protein
MKPNDREMTLRGSRSGYMQVTRVDCAVFCCSFYATQCKARLTALMLRKSSLDVEVFDRRFGYWNMPGGNEHIKSRGVTLLV